MDREIKFRAWDLINNRFINLLRITFSVDGKYLGCHDIEGNLYGPHQVKLIQYTGLKDKNGVDICEGDIVEMFVSEARGGDWYKHPVSYHNGGFGILLHEGCFRSFSRPYSDDLSSIILIGNIYENPELLKKGE